MSDNLTKGRIQKYLNKIAAEHLTAPDVSSIASLDEQEAVLKAFWNDNKPAVLPKQSVKEAKVSIKAVADDRVAALEKDLAEMKALMAQAIAANKGGGGITTDDLLKVLQKAASGQQDEYKLMRPEYIPVDDMMEKAETFFVANGNHRVWGKRIGDHWTPPPFNYPNLH